MQAANRIGIAVLFRIKGLINMLNKEKMAKSLEQPTPKKRKRLKEFFRGILEKPEKDKKFSAHRSQREAEILHQESGEKECVEQPLNGSLQAIHCSNSHSLVASVRPPTPEESPGSSPNELFEKLIAVDFDQQFKVRTTYPVSKKEKVTFSINKLNLEQLKSDSPFLKERELTPRVSQADMRTRSTISRSSVEKPKKERKNRLSFGSLSKLNLPHPKKDTLILFDEEFTSSNESSTSETFSTTFDSSSDPDRTYWSGEDNKSDRKRNKISAHKPKKPANSLMPEGQTERNKIPNQKQKRLLKDLGLASRSVGEFFSSTEPEEPEEAEDAEDALKLNNRLEDSNEIKCSAKEPQQEQPPSAEAHQKELGGVDLADNNPLVINQEFKLTREALDLALKGLDDFPKTISSTSLGDESADATDNSDTGKGSWIHKKVEFEKQSDINPDKKVSKKSGSFIWGVQKTSGNASSSGFSRPGNILSGKSNPYNPHHIFSEKKSRKAIEIEDKSQTLKKNN